jgi:riboflavin synthase
MFTGIVEASAWVEQVEPYGSGLRFWLRSPLASEFRIDQSVAHDGCCLTVDALNPPLYRVTAIAETLNKTNLAHWKPGTEVNLERAMAAGARLDGHIVQGHVDLCGTCLSLSALKGSWELRVGFRSDTPQPLVPKGSVAINGVSLTVVACGADFLTVHLIPYTFEHTNLRLLRQGDAVNLEFDILGKYVWAYLENQISHKHGAVK